MVGAAQAAYEPDYEYGIDDTDMRAALTAALAKAWRPIEEAPDDVEVLVCGYACAGFYTTNAKKIDGDWMLFVPDDDDFTAESSGHTHWMPLSEPPATKEAGER
jgi:hypothetical protein